MRYALVTAALVTVLGGGMGAASATAAPTDHHKGDGDICILDEQPCT